MTILLIQSAFAWEVQTTDGGAEYHWHAMPLDYIWVADGAPALDDIDGAVNRAFDSWAEVPVASIEVTALSAANATGEVNLDDDHVVFFEDDWPLGNQALAVATTWADESGRVVSFDIRVNATVSWSTTDDEGRFDLQAAMTHEVGHVLGLEHSSVHDATMFASHDVGEGWRQNLHQDDQEAVGYLYELAPAGGDAPAGAGCRTGPGLAGWAWLLPLVVVARRTRRHSC